MRKISRREAVTAIVGAGGAGLIGSGGSAGAQVTDTPLVFSGRHQPKPLPFNPARLKGISEKLIKSHWENNYAGAIKALNTVENRLAAVLKEKDLPAYLYGDLKREELIRTGSVVLHELYFANLGPGSRKADGTALKLIEKWFGSYDAWEMEFKKTAQALAGGSGWVVLGFNEHTRQMHNYWQADHAHNPSFTRPVLVLDMYEHSYQMDYGAEAGKYIDAFMQNLNWDEVNRRLEDVR
jgi:superoxide dismutase, Fe-Mn family